MSSPHGSTRKSDSSFALHRLSAFSKVLSRRHREVAMRDTAFAEALRKQTIYPQRIDALVAGRTWFTGKPCKTCGSSRRRVRDCACYDCRLKRRPLLLDHRNRAYPWPATYSRAGWKWRLDEIRREKAGEVQQYVAGVWDGDGPDTRWYGTETPTGRLAVRCDSAVWSVPGLPRLASTQFAGDAFGCDPPRLRFDCPDLRLYDGRQLYMLAERNDGLRQLLEQAARC
jgi:hypothetical protein